MTAPHDSNGKGGKGLDDLSGAELNRLFAEKVCGWPLTDGVKRKLLLDETPFPNFTTSADAVLPWLEKSNYAIQITFCPSTDMWCVELIQRFTGTKSFQGKGETFPLAAVRARLKAKGYSP